MIKMQIRILGIAPYAEMHQMMENAAQAYPDIQMDVLTGDLEKGVAIVQGLQPDSYDCIISRGGTATLINQVSNLPVVEIQLSVYDVLNAIKLAKNYSNSFAIVGFPNITEPAHTLCDLLGYNQNIVTVYNTDEATQKLEQLQKEGCQMVVCDMITHTIARKMGLDAFLITSGMESLYSAIDQSIQISQWFGRLRQENMYLRSITQDQNGRVVVLNTDGTLYYSSPTAPPEELIQALQARLREVPPKGSQKFYFSKQNQLYLITGQTLIADNKQYLLFYCMPSRIPLQSSWGKGIRTMNRGECEYLLSSSFYSISGSMGKLDAEIRALAITQQPVMIRGEAGVGKEQIARFLYLNSSLVNRPFILINCDIMNEKSWEFLLNHESSPLNAVDTLIYFQNFESLSEMRAKELLSVILETGLARRLRLIFSYVCKDSEPAPAQIHRFSTKLGCQTLTLPSLRNRSDEIPSLANLYLDSLKPELGKKIFGFEPRAIEMLQQYDWPNNYSQFKHVLRASAALTTSSYIRGSSVAEILAKERQANCTFTPPAAEASNTEATLEEIIHDVIQQAVRTNNGNRSAAARQLGISRTTLWRYLGKGDPGALPIDE